VCTRARRVRCAMPCLCVSGGAARLIDHVDVLALLRMNSCPENHGRAVVMNVDGTARWAGVRGKHDHKVICYRENWHVGERERENYRRQQQKPSRAHRKVARDLSRECFDYLRSLPLVTYLSEGGGGPTDDAARASGVRASGSWAVVNAAPPAPAGAAGPLHSMVANAHWLMNGAPPPHPLGRT
jgi:hypothetical protein